MTPIEQKLWDAAGDSLQMFYRHPKSHQTIAQVTQAFEREPAAHIMLARQVMWGPFTADFVAVGRRDDSCFAIVVECDGHDFHERTKEQARHDRSRDRYFMKQAVPVLRFTGSEIWKDAEQCLLDIVTCLAGHHALEWATCLDRRPAYVNQRMVQAYEDESLDMSIKMVTLVAAQSADDQGVARISFELLRQWYGIAEADLDIIGFDLAPYLSMRSIDVHGRLVFRFHPDNERGVE